MARAVDIETRKANTKLKAEWVEQLVLDKQLSHRGHRVGAFLAWRFDKGKGCSIVGRETMAEQLGVTDRTIDKAIAELERLGHVTVERSRGRGLANTYRPILKKANVRAGKGEDLGEKRRTNVRPLPIDSPYISPGYLVSHAEPAARPQAMKKGASSNAPPAFAFKDRGKHQRDLADKLPGNPIANMERLSELSEERLTHWCRRQRNAPESVDLGALFTELNSVSSGRSGSGTC